MKAFIAIWTGQVFSLIGTSMTSFALGIWAWKATGSATALALMGVFFTVPMMVFSPLAGAFVDRSNRKVVMALSDLAAGVMTLFILIMYLSGHLQIWQLYLAGALEGVFQTFQWPAYSAAISTMIPKDQLIRANSMIGIAESGAGILAPIFAGALLGLVGLEWIFLIDLTTLVIALSLLAWVVVPQPQITEEGLKSRGNIWQESLYGFKYIFTRPSMLGLQLIFLVGNLMSSGAMTLVTPMILARTANNANYLAWVESAAGVGGVIGAAILSAWGGPKRRFNGVAGGWLLCGVFTILFGLGRSLPVWIISFTLLAMVSNLINSSNQAIWQTKTPPDVQGRVFSIRRLIAQVASPLGMIIAAPLADKVFEPGMKLSGSPLANTFGPIFGAGVGTGMSVIMAICGLFIIISTLVGFFTPSVRNVEAIMPDYENTPPPAAEAEPAI
jgi:hypothetical protein